MENSVQKKHFPYKIWLKGEGGEVKNVQAIFREVIDVLTVLSILVHSDDGAFEMIVILDDATHSLFSGL